MDKSVQTITSLFSNLLNELDDAITVADTKTIAEQLNSIYDEVENALRGFNILTEDRDR